MFFLPNLRQVLWYFSSNSYTLSPLVFGSSTLTLSAPGWEKSRWPPLGRESMMRRMRRVTAGRWRERKVLNSDSEWSPSFCGLWCPVEKRENTQSNQEGVLDQNSISARVFNRVCRCSYEPRWADSSPWGCRISAPVWWSLSGDPGTSSSPHPAPPSEMHSPETQPAAHTLHREKHRERKNTQGSPLKYAVCVMLQREKNYLLVLVLVQTSEQRDLLSLCRNRPFLSAGLATP